VLGSRLGPQALQGLHARIDMMWLSPEDLNVRKVPLLGDAQFFEPWVRPCQWKLLRVTTNTGETRFHDFLRVDSCTDVDTMIVSKARFGKGHKHSLNALCANLNLPSKRSDMGASEMFRIVESTRCARGGQPLSPTVAGDVLRMADYCLRDVVLTEAALGDLGVLTELSLMGWVMYTHTSDVMRRGNTTRVLSQMVALGWGSIVFDVAPDGWLHQDAAPLPYRGASCLAAVPDVYEEYTVTVDVNSLYPSNAKAANLSMDTLLVDPGKVAVARSRGLRTTQFTGRELVKMEAILDVGDPRLRAFLDATVHFVQYIPGDERHRQGLVSKFMAFNVDTRNRVRKVLMKAEKDPVKHKLLDVFQNVLKVAANSGYGALACASFKLPTPFVAAAITAYGRRIIAEMVRVINTVAVRETLVLRENLAEIAASALRRLEGDPGAAALVTTDYVLDRIVTFYDRHPSEAKVIGGDTDSTFFKVPVAKSADTPPQELAVGLGVADWMVVRICEQGWINALNREMGFPPAVLIAVEYISRATILIKKKNYALMFKENATDPQWKPKQKGLPSIKGDVPLIIRTAFQRVMEALQTRGLEGAKQELRVHIARIMDPTTPLDDFAKVIRLQDPSDKKNATAEQFQVFARSRRLVAALKWDSDKAPPPQIGDMMPMVLLTHCPDASEVAAPKEREKVAHRWAHLEEVRHGMMPWVPRGMPRPVLDRLAYLQYLNKKIAIIPSEMVPDDGELKKPSQMRRCRIMALYDVVHKAVILETLKRANAGMVCLWPDRPPLVRPDDDVVCKTNEVWAAYKKRQADKRKRVREAARTRALRTLSPPRVLGPKRPREGGGSVAGEVQPRPKRFSALHALC
jgi:hypothetical protein